MSRSNTKLYTALKALLGDKPGSVLSHEEQAYHTYLNENSPSPQSLTLQRQADTKGLPIFAIVIMRQGKGSEDIQRTKDSIADQTYSRWEITDGPEEGNWEYIMYMQAGDTLAPDALYHYAVNTKEHDLIYCDEDRGGQNGRQNPVFKPEPDMITQLSYDMLGSGIAVSRRLFNEAGGIREYNGSDRYGYNLRCLKRADSPYHISQVLYTCGEHLQPSSDARRHVEQAAGRGSYVMPGEWQGSFRVEAVVKQPGVAVIISNKNSCEPLLRLLMSIDDTLGQQKTSIIIADRGSTDSRTLRYYDILERNQAAKVYYGGDVGMPALLNSAASEANADVAVFMQSTAETLSHNWIGDLLAQTMRKSVGAAGPRIISAEGRLLHCGDVIGIQGWRGSPYCGCGDDRGDERKLTFVRTTRRVSGLSSICMMVRMETFFNVGCFDESFEEAGFDTELCLRMAGRGYASVYAPNALIKSYVPPLSIQEASEKDMQRYYDAVRETLVRGDPYYNINFDYSSPLPKAALHPAPPINLNTIFNEK